MHRFKLPVATVLLAGLLCSAAAAAGPKIRLNTSMGDIDIELNQAKAPKTTAHILKLVDDGFYAGLVFPRVLANFVIQAGGYLPNLEYREPPGTVVNESSNGLSNVKGSVAMARLNDPDSADTQFYINVNDNTRLDATPTQPGYTVFGTVVAGWDTVVEIELTDVGMSQGMAGVPETPVIIHKASRL